MEAFFRFTFVGLIFYALYVYRYEVFSLLDLVESFIETRINELDNEIEVLDEEIKAQEIKRQELLSELSDDEEFEPEDFWAD